MVRPWAYHVRIAYLGAFSFPGSTAPSHRVRGVADALMLAGHQVTVVPFFHGDDVDDRELRLDLSLARRAIPSSLRNGAEMLLGGGREVAWVGSKRHDFDAVLLYGTPTALLGRYQWASRGRRNRLPPLVLDVVEWYDYASRPGGRYGPFALEHAVAMNKLAARADAAICISTFLARHLERHGCPTTVIPPLFDADYVPSEFASLDPKRMQIGYAGAPGAKDGQGLANLVAATVELPAALRGRVQLQIVGLNRDQGYALLRRYMLGSVPSMTDTVAWHGRLPARAAQSLIGACDFTFLQRPQERYAMAGFPTKVAESLVLGTPVITNTTSDLASYVTDGQNGVLLDRDGLDGASLAAVRAALLRLTTPGFRLGLGREQIRARSSEAFSPAHYAAALDRLMTTAVQRNEGRRPR